MADSEHIIVAATSRVGINELLDKVSDKDGMIQLFDEEAIACREHLEFAYINAVRMHQRGDSRTRSLAMEMLLCVAMASQIGDAIKRAGAKTEKRFIVFSDSRQAYGKLREYLIKPVEFNPEKRVKARLVGMGIKSGNVEDLIQEIALHAMER